MVLTEWRCEMAIVYYPNRIYKKVVPAIDREMDKRDPLTSSGRQDINASALDVTISANTAWQVTSVGFEFNNAKAKDFDATIRNGRKVVTNLNDALWFQIETSLPQSIVLDPAFYTGTELAAELATQLDANTVFAAAGLTFTVTYTAATGLYTIAPSSGSLRYLNVNDSQTLRTRDSIAGHLFGFNANTVFAVSISSDTTVYGLDSTGGAIVNETASTALNFRNTDVQILTVDQALHLGSSSGVDSVITYTVINEDLV